MVHNVWFWSIHSMDNLSFYTQVDIIDCDEHQNTYFSRRSRYECLRSCVQHPYALIKHFSYEHEQIEIFNDLDKLQYIDFEFPNADEFTLLISNRPIGWDIESNFY